MSFKLTLVNSKRFISKKKKKFENLSYCETVREFKSIRC